MNKLNPSDSSHNQLWRFTQDGCIENIGMNNRSKMGERYVLDVLDRGGFALMMLKQNSARDRFQKWQFTPVRVPVVEVFFSKYAMKNYLLLNNKL